MTVYEQLQALAEKVNDNPIHIQGEKDRAFEFRIAGESPVQLVFEQGQMIIREGTPLEPELVLSMSPDHFHKLLTGSLNTTMAFMTGGLKVDGKMGLALKLQDILKKYS